MIKLPMTTLTAVSTGKWPTTLKPASAVCEALGISEERLVELADAGYAPHYRIDNGTPLFMVSELKEWAAYNLLTRVAGKTVPAEVKVYENVLRPVQDFRTIPDPIKGIDGLKDLTPMLASGIISGIYFLCQGSEVVYVGQSVCVSARVGEHTKTKQFDRVFYLPWERSDLDRLEGALIRHLRPRLNGKIHNGTMIAPAERPDEPAVIKMLYGEANDHTRRKSESQSQARS